MPCVPIRVVAIVTTLVIGLAPSFGASSAVACTSDGECASDERCHLGGCSVGTCVPAAAVTGFPASGTGHTAYTAPMSGVLDHSGLFYTQCCDDQITAFTGETAMEGVSDLGCPAEPDEFPTCFVTPGCICAYGHPTGGAFVANGNYVGVGLGPGFLSYDGHAGYDYAYGASAPLYALADGMLCKAEEDHINGRVGAPTAWDKFHTFYVDHGVFDGVGYAAWYLHATDLIGSLQTLNPGECAAVTEGQHVASVGNVGTFLPHLHFEFRTYFPAQGPEATSSNVIDPYGWTGADPDPWADPSENFQAETRGAPLWIACGNGRLECGEQCDDGNTVDGDCCSATCQLETAGSPCDDGDVCTGVDVCDGAGGCVGAAGPDPLCREAPRGALLLRDRLPDSRDVFTWKWTKGPATSAAELGDPVDGTTGYELCVFDQSGGAHTLALRAQIAAGGLCGTKPCWKAAGGGANGYRYNDRDGTADGIRKLVLKPGADGKPKVILKGKGEGLALPSFPLAQDTSVTVQLSNTQGVCWVTTFDAPATKNDAAQFKDKHKAP